MVAQYVFPDNRAIFQDGRQQFFFSCFFSLKKNTKKIGGGPQKGWGRGRLPLWVWLGFVLCVLDGQSLCPSTYRIVIPDTQDEKHPQWKIMLISKGKSYGICVIHVYHDFHLFLYCEKLHLLEKDSLPEIINAQFTLEFPSGMYLIAFHTPYTCHEYEHPTFNSVKLSLSLSSPFLKHL